VQQTAWVRDPAAGVDAPPEGSQELPQPRLNAAHAVTPYNRSDTRVSSRIALGTVETERWPPDPLGVRSIYAGADAW